MISTHYKHADLDWRFKSWFPIIRITMHEIVENIDGGRIPLY